MALTRALVALAVAVSGFNLLAPAFVSAVARCSTAGHQRSQHTFTKGFEQPGHAFGGSVALAAVGLCGAGMVGAARRRKVVKEQRTVMKVDASGLFGGGPIVAYMQALMDGAEKSGEQVSVTKDVMKFRKMLETEKTFEGGTSFEEELAFIQNDFDYSPAQKAKKICELVGNMESTVFPKFIVFLAKKRRIAGLFDILNEYVSNLYYNQSIAPVICTAAHTLTEEQETNIKQKMQEKIGVKDVKLIVQVDNSLIAGFKLAWDLTDPEDPASATRGLDYSFKAILTNAALAKGVVATV